MKVAGWWRGQIQRYRLPLEVCGECGTKNLGRDICPKCGNEIVPLGTDVNQSLKEGKAPVLAGEIEMFGRRYGKERGC
jgi:uncharacterized OB-fold protein